MIVALEAWLCFALISSALGESATADEPIFVGAGYSYLRTGDFRMNPEQPPIAKLLSALPLLRFGLVWRTDTEAWRKSDSYGVGIQLFRANAAKEDGMLLAGRLPSIALTLALGLAIALWTRASFGSAAAMTALMLYAFDPTIAAHGHYATTDIAVTLLSFLTCIAWGEFLKRPNPRRLALAGVCLGVALATKFSALFLFPAMLILYAIRWWQTREVMRPWRGLLSLAVTVFIAAVVVSAVYAVPAVIHGGAPDVRPFFVGLRRFLEHNTYGHRAYLLGKFSMHGWWYYFPVAFAVKTPVATLVFIGLALWTAVRQLPYTQLRAASFGWFVSAVPLVVFGSFCLCSHINIGIRHLLPAWPFLFVLSAAAFTRARFRYSTALLVLVGVGLAFESVAIAPHYLAFFNVLAGGPEHGPMLLADSNIDWGQDAKNLRDWLRVHPPSPGLCLDYWGNADISRLGVMAPSLLERWNTERHIPTDCVEAISVNYLYGLAPNSGEILKTLPPEARIGYSIYIYNLPKLRQQGRLPASMISGDTALQVSWASVKPAFVNVLHQNLLSAPSPSDPARAGEILAFFMTGLGPVIPPVPADRPAPLDTLSYTVFPVSCHWNTANGWAPAEILFAGLAPGRVGIFQVNARVALGASGEIACSTVSAFGVRSTESNMFVPLAGR